MLADDLFSRTIHHKQTTGLFRIAHLSKQVGTKQNAPDSSNHGTLRRSVLPRKLFSTTLLPVWIRAMTGRNANLVTESRWRIQAAKLHPKDSDSEISLLDFKNQILSPTRRRHEVSHDYVTRWHFEAVPDTNLSLIAMLGSRSRLSLTCHKPLTSRD